MFYNEFLYIKSRSSEFVGQKRKIFFHTASKEVYYDSESKRFSYIGMNGEFIVEPTLHNHSVPLIGESSLKFKLRIYKDRMLH